MSPAFYRACRLACQFIHVQCIRHEVSGLDRVPSSGGAILAVTHISHLEPIVVSTVLRRRVRWMARVEFYRTAWARWMLDMGGAFPVDRFGWSLPAVRWGASLVREGNVIGVFPEGGVSQGCASVLLGGSIHAGVCTIAHHTQTPIIPVVVLGTHELNRVGPWLPFRRARLWTAFGEPVVPPSLAITRKQARLQMRERLEHAFRALYENQLAQHSLLPSIVPDREVRMA